MSSLTFTKTRLMMNWPQSPWEDSASDKLKETSKRWFLKLKSESKVSAKSSKGQSSFTKKKVFFFLIKKYNKEHSFAQRWIKNNSDPLWISKNSELSEIKWNDFDIFSKMVEIFLLGSNFRRLRFKIITWNTKSNFRIWKVIKHNIMQVIKRLVSKISKESVFQQII